MAQRVADRVGIGRIEHAESRRRRPRRPKSLWNTSGARLEPPIPNSTTSVNRRARTRSYERVDARQVRRGELDGIEPSEAIGDRLPDAVVAAPQVGVARPQRVGETRHDRVVKKRCRAPGRGRPVRWRSRSRDTIPIAHATCRIRLRVFVVCAPWLPPPARRASRRLLANHRRPRHLAAPAAPRRCRSSAHRLPRRQSDGRLWSRRRTVRSVARPEAARRRGLQVRGRQRRCLRRHVGRRTAATRLVARRRRADSRRRAWRQRRIAWPAGRGDEAEPEDDHSDGEEARHRRAAHGDGGAAELRRRVHVGVPPRVSAISRPRSASPSCRSICTRSPASQR